MIPNPKMFSARYAAHFQDAGIIEAYHHRPPYPAEIFEILSGLIVDTPRVVLDAGCGPGDIARELLEYVERIDAVDFSKGMIEKGRNLPGGTHPAVNWIHGPMEDVALSPPYSLVTAGDSLSWMEWDIVLGRFGEILTQGGCLALVNRGWGAGLAAEGNIASRYSSNQDYQPLDLIGELESRGLFRKLGEKRGRPVPWTPSIDEYIEARHSQNGFSRQRMGVEHAAAFDAELGDLLIRHKGEGDLELLVQTRVTWGVPVGRF